MSNVSVNSSKSSASIPIPKGHMRSTPSAFGTIVPLLKGDIESVFGLLDTISLSDNINIATNQIIDFLKPGSDLYSHLQEFYVTASILGTPTTSTWIPYWVKTPIGLLEKLVRELSTFLDSYTFSSSYDVSRTLAELYKGKKPLFEYLAKQKNANSNSNSSNSENEGASEYENNAPFGNLNNNNSARIRTRSQRKRARRTRKNKRT